MRFIEAGWYVPCVDTNVKANVTEYHPEGAGKNGRTNKELTLTLGIISNVGKNHWTFIILRSLCDILIKCFEKILENNYLLSTGELPKTNDSTFDNHTVRVEILVSASRGASSGDSLPWTLSVDTSGTDSSPETVPTETLNVVDPTTKATEVKELVANFQKMFYFSE